MRESKVLLEAERWASGAAAVGAQRTLSAVGCPRLEVCQVPFLACVGPVTRCGLRLGEALGTGARGDASARLRGDDASHHGVAPHCGCRSATPPQLMARAHDSTLTMSLSCHAPVASAHGALSPTQEAGACTRSRPSGPSLGQTPGRISGGLTPRPARQRTPSASTLRTLLRPGPRRGAPAVPASRWRSVWSRRVAPGSTRSCGTTFASSTRATPPRWPRPVTRAPRRANDAPRDADDRRAVLLPPRERLKAWRPAQTKPRARQDLVAPRRRLVKDRTRGRKRLTARLHADAPPG
jgi:hypothetical protein